MRTKNLLLKPQSCSNFRYRLLFVSIIPPHYAGSFNIFTAAFVREQENLREPNKYYIKYSYLIFAWFYHLKTLNTQNISDATDAKMKKMPIKFNILPTKRTHYTLTKAPMAHKKNSKEQFCFKYYFVTANFKGNTKPSHVVNSCDAAAVLLTIIKNLFPVFSTNVLFIKTSTISFSYSDRNFFNYLVFLKQMKKNSNN